MQIQNLTPEQISDLFYLQNECDNAIESLICDRREMIKGHTDRIAKIKEIRDKLRFKPETDNGVLLDISYSISPEARAIIKSPLAGLR